MTRARIDAIHEAVSLGDVLCVCVCVCAGIKELC